MVGHGPAVAVGGGVHGRWHNVAGRGWAVCCDDVQCQSTERWPIPVLEGLQGLCTVHGRGLTCASGGVQMGWSVEDWTGVWRLWQSKVCAQVRVCQQEVVAPVNDTREPLQIQQTQQTRAWNLCMEPVQDPD